MTSNNNCFIIAEAGVNHNGSLTIAKKLVDAAASAGADAVKFQTFKADLITVPTASKAAYQIENTGNNASQHSMLQALELPASDFAELLRYSKAAGIKFLSTPFDTESLKELVLMGVDLLKISSGDITNAPLLLKAAQTGLPVIISSGASDLNDIRNALAVLAFGYQYPNSIPQTHDQCLEAFDNYEAMTKLKDKVTILHCTTNYPAAFTDINMNAMHTIGKEFGMRVGYSDHSTGILVSIVAAALGASVIEKHFTLDKSMPGPDHKASLDPEELKSMVRSIRDTQAILGNAIKKPSEAELRNKTIVRRGIYAGSDIASGQPLNLENIIALRPENSISPLEVWNYLDKPAKKNYKRYETI